MSTINSGDSAARRTEGSLHRDGSVAALKYCELCHTEHHPHSPETCDCNCCKLSKNFVRLPKPEELEPTDEEKHKLECLLAWQELSAKSPMRLGNETPLNDEIRRPGPDAPTKQ